MESTRILILETACGGAAPNGDDASSFASLADNDCITDEACSSSAEGGSIPRLALQDEEWLNHSSSALLQCDIALLPDDLTLSREEFLAAVWRFPRQVLHPCGTENLLIFPPTRVSEYQLTITSCQMQATPIFAESLPVAAALPADPTRIGWASHDKHQVVLTRVKVALNLEESKGMFSQQFASKSRSIGLSFFDTDETHYNMDNKTEVLFLLQSLKAKIESDVRAVDNILAVMTLVSVILVLCLIKLTFFGESTLQRNQSSPLQPKPARLSSKEQSTERPPKRSWLAPSGVFGKGTILFPSPLATPRWTRPDSTSTVRRPPPPPPPSNVTSDSPNPALDTWMRSKDQRRRNRPIDVEPQRLIAPCITPPRGEKDQPEATTVATQTANGSLACKTVTPSVPSSVSSNHAQSAKESPTKKTEVKQIIQDFY